MKKSKIVSRVAASVLGLTSTLSYFSNVLAYEDGIASSESDKEMNSLDISIAIPDDFNILESEVFIRSKNGIAKIRGIYKDPENGNYVLNICGIDSGSDVISVGIRNDSKNKTINYSVDIDPNKDIVLKSQNESEDKLENKPIDGFVLGTAFHLPKAFTVKDADILSSDGSVAFDNIEINAKDGTVKIWVSPLEKGLGVVFAQCKNENKVFAYDLGVSCVNDENSNTLKVTKSKRQIMNVDLVEFTEVVDGNLIIENLNSIDMGNNFSLSIPDESFTGVPEDEFVRQYNVNKGVEISDDSEKKIVVKNYDSYPDFSLIHLISKDGKSRIIYYVNKEDNSVDRVIMTED